MDWVCILADTVDGAAVQHGVDGCRLAPSHYAAAFDRRQGPVPVRRSCHVTEHTGSIEGGLLIRLIERANMTEHSVPIVTPRGSGTRCTPSVLQECAADAISGELPRHTLGEIDFRT